MMSLIIKADEAPAQGSDHGLGAIADAQFLKDVVDVEFNGAFGDVEGLGEGASAAA